MKLDSKYFDRIRIRPEQPPLQADEPVCEWEGCSRAGAYRAPKGRHQEGKYFRFCLDHVRDYNKSYNYFAGMAEDEVTAYQRSAFTGHRPTWSMGVNGSTGGGGAAYRRSWSADLHDTFGIFGGFGARKPELEPNVRPLKNLERKSFAALDLEGHETGTEIKARYKNLVKKLHPDANGGDRSFEDRLREIITAYNHLKAAGFC
jgi:curved DNA-binding protein CbpA